MPDTDAAMLTDSNSTPAEAGQAAVASVNECVTVKFWGVRGSVPTPGADTVRYGGNTACVEIQLPGHRLVFDGGTGLRVLGKHLLEAGQPVSAHIFFTHTHWDRIQGFPFFGPAFIAGNHFDVYGATAANGASIKQRLTDQMLRPNFFTPLQKMSSTMKFHNIAAGNIIRLDDHVTVEAISLNSATSALGFRVNYAGKSVVYATDSYNADGGPDPSLLYLAQAAELLVYGGTYSEPVYASVGGDPQAISCEQSIAIAEKTQVKEMILFHHNPRHDDDYLDHLEMEIHNRCPQLRLAREGMTLQP
ncbi:MBL fold metallo-hydrolase [Halomicronema sp. CCY15110]|uniref:MBL fold metallo-hydrolase n=1 Tax=Halomicronema sp. CCY15110 TaxID=2767773 RepID=UPI001EF21608|nr:MBL fold metallo-hydrolase [Halomicronema sp. CCY15110]